MPQTEIRQNIFENEGIGPLLRVDLIPHVIGEIHPLSFPPDEMPDGFHLCNGDQYPIDSKAGAALDGLSAAFKAAWGITDDGLYINVPNLFDDAGDGYFPRFVDGVTRQVGSVQDYGQPNITGAMNSYGAGVFDSNATNIADNAFFLTGNPYAAPSTQSGAQGKVTLGFDASRCPNVKTASEIRPKNAGFLAAIYLGAGT